MNFSQALEHLKAGKAMRRKGWATKGALIYVHQYVFNELVAPCICWVVPDQRVQPGWLCSMGDMFADDWEIVEPTPV